VAGDWVTVLELHERSGSLCVHSRISDLRRAGYAIQNRTKRDERGRVLSEYRLLDNGPPPVRDALPHVVCQRAEGEKHREEDQATFECPLPSVRSSRPWPD